MHVPAHVRPSNRGPELHILLMCLSETLDQSLYGGASDAVSRSDKKGSEEVATAARTALQPLPALDCLTTSVFEALQPARLEVPERSLAAFEVTFDQAVAAMSSLPGLHIEPDGYFWWHGTESEQDWQLSGMIYERPASLSEASAKCESRLGWCEIKGICPFRNWCAWVECLQTPTQRIVVFLQRERFHVPLHALQRMWPEP